MAKKSRNHNCENYDECLDVAAKGDFEFDCIGCDEKTIIIKEKKAVKNSIPAKKRGPKPKTDLILRDRVYIDFTNYPELLEILQEEAEKEFRSLSMQLLFYVKTACDLKKK